MIDIDDIYEACRYCHQYIGQFQVRMLLWREAIRPRRIIHLGPVTMRFGVLAAKMAFLSASMQGHAEVVIEESTRLKPHKEFDLRREKRKAQWKDETRMRNGRNWKR